MVQPAHDMLNWSDTPPHASQLDDASAIASSSPCPIKTACISHQKKKSPPPSDPVILLPPPSLRLSAANGVVESCPYTDFDVSPQYPCWATLPCAHDDPWAPNLQLQALSKSDQCRSIHAQGPPHRKRSPVHIRLLLLSISASSGFPSTFRPTTILLLLNHLRSFCDLPLRGPPHASQSIHYPF